MIRRGRGVHSPADVDVAQWLFDRVPAYKGDVVTVGDILPHGFDRYARALHPAFDYSGGHVTWRIVAEWTGHKYGPEMLWGEVSEPREPGRKKPWQNEARVGRCPRSVRKALAQVLRDHSAVPQSCYFGVWEGYAGVAEYLAGNVMFGLQGRRYILVAAPLDIMEDGLLIGNEAFSSAVNMWWPADRAWSVYTDIESRSTYVGGSADCVSALMQCQDIETIAVSPQHCAD